MDKGIYIRTFVITTIVFIAGLAAGLWLGETKVTDLEATVTGLQKEIEDTELQFLLFDTLNEDVPCSYLNTEAAFLGNEADALGREVEKYEATQKLDDASFYEMKKKYTNTIIKDWLMIEKIKDTCEGNYSVVLFFYSNNECPDCEKQGCHCRRSPTGG